MFGKFIKDLFNQTTAPSMKLFGHYWMTKTKEIFYLDSFQPTDIEIPESYFTDISKLNVYDQGNLGLVSHMFSQQLNNTTNTKTPVQSLIFLVVLYIILVA